MNLRYEIELESDGYQVQQVLGYVCCPFYGPVSHFHEFTWRTVEEQSEIPFKKKAEVNIIGKRCLECSIIGRWSLRLLNDCCY